MAHGILMNLGSGGDTNNAYDLSLGDVAHQTTGKVPASSLMVAVDASHAPAPVTRANPLPFIPVRKWAVFHAPSTATQATITKAAGAAGIAHCCSSVSATLATNGTAQTPITVALRDGATGAGTILWSAVLAAPVNGFAHVTASGLDIIGSAATAMTLEFSGAGVAASAENVSLSGYDVTL